MTAIPAVLPVSMCGPCRAAADRWLDSRPSGRVTIHTIGGSVRDVTDARRLAADDHRALVRRQIAAIRVRCAAGDCRSEPAEVVPAN